MTTPQRVNFNAVYDWLAARKDLSGEEKLLIAHILRFGRSGCWKNNGTLARDLGIHRGSIARMIRRLEQREIVAALYDHGGKERVLFIFEEAIDGPLLKGLRGCGYAVKNPVKLSGSAQQECCAARQESGDVLRSATALYRKSKDLSSDERLKREVKAVALGMKETAGAGISGAELNRKRNQMRRALGLEDQ